MIPMASAGIVSAIRRRISPGKCSTVLLTAGTADEVAGVPVSERDLAPRGGGVEYFDAPALDKEDAVLRTALAEQLGAAVEHAPFSGTQHLRDFGFGQPAEQ